MSVEVLPSHCPRLWCALVGRSASAADTESLRTAVRRPGENIATAKLGTGVGLKRERVGESRGGSLVSLARGESVAVSAPTEAPQAVTEVSRTSAGARGPTGSGERSP